MKKTMILLACAVMAAGVQAQVIDFESASGYTAVGVYDCWEQSPFHTGALEGNVAICDNPDSSVSEMLGEAPNPSAKVAGAQRSRFGSNRFGLRVDLEESFELTPTPKYVHVKLLKPTAGRVMLVGLGSRTALREAGTQEKYVEQFWNLSTNTAEPGQWNDMVFQVKGAGGIDIFSLVLVPDCESPHALADDFLFYIDDIEVNDKSTPAFSLDWYAISFDKDNDSMTRTDRYTTNIKLTDANNKSQTCALNQLSSKKGYYDMTLEMPFNVKAGQTYTPVVGYKGTWMHGYCYVDLDNNGHFDPDTEAVAYSYADGKNSTGASANNNVGVGMPSFTVPADLKPGLYRMRFKVDWDCLDPAGNSDSGNKILSNGGVIADIMMNVCADQATVNDNQLNGEVLAADGSKLNALQVPALEDLGIRMNPEKGFENDGFLLTYGYELTEEQMDKHGNPRWLQQDFTKSGTDYTIPGKYVWGSLLIEGRMVESPEGAIESPEAGAPEALQTYDLLGRPLAPQAPGLHIARGSKVLKR